MSPAPGAESALYDSPLHHFLVLEEDDGPPSQLVTDAVPASSQGSDVAGASHDPAANTPSTAAVAVEEALFHPWRVRERMRTGNAVLVLCLNIGIDPPDVIKPSACARLECWVDPSLDDVQKIGTALTAQYERWQPRAKYKFVPDPTTAELRRVTMMMRRNAKEDRLLFHYNGHGVPKPTPNGEIWVFSRDYTQYIPLALYDVQDWVGTPGLYVWDCNNAGIIVQEFLRFATVREEEAARNVARGDPAAASAPNHRDSILLAACAANQLLPQDPELPADLFSCCLTTPIKTSLRWFLQRSPISGVTLPMLEHIPGKLIDRGTPLGELNWIFTAVTDTIAWNVLPRDVFKRLFRQDLLLASLMRNFLLADRIMRSVDCTPVSHPKLPRTHDHPLWQSYDNVLERCLVQLPDHTAKHYALVAKVEADKLMTEADSLWEVYHTLYNNSFFTTRSGQQPGIREYSVSLQEAGILTGNPNYAASSQQAGVGISANAAEPSAPCDAAAETASGEASLGGRVSFALSDDVNEGLLHGAYSSGMVNGFHTGSDNSDAASSRLPGSMPEESAQNRQHVPDAFFASRTPSSISEVEAARKHWLKVSTEAAEQDQRAREAISQTNDVKYEPIPFFEMHMHSFATWLDMKPEGREDPEQLPVMLQVLLSQTFRVDALRLLSRYLQTGQRAVDLALSVGYFPYVLKLLQSDSPELMQELVFIWGKIIALDPSTCEWTQLLCKLSAFVRTNNASSCISCHGIICFVGCGENKR
jgi:Raptor N-terminal CASPase like domain